MAETLKVTNVTMRSPATAQLAEGAAAGPAQVAIELANSGDKPLHAWSSRRGYEYDENSHVLTLYLTDRLPDPPPGIKLISNHPRTPSQVAVPAKGRATIEVPVPAFIRRRVAGEGLGMSFVELPIIRVDRVDVHVQYGPQPIKSIKEETPDDHRKRLIAHGDVLRSSQPLGQAKK